MQEAGSGCTVIGTLESVLELANETRMRARREEIRRLTAGCDCRTTESAPINRGSEPSFLDPVLKSFASYSSDVPCPSLKPR
jgi:hypothetical protein